MIEPERRKAIFLLHREGMGVNEISRRLSVSKKTINVIVKQKGDMPERTRKDKRSIDEELLSRLYGECDGRIQRIHEKLGEEEGIKIGYTTLTRMIRESGIGEHGKKRCSRVPDEPGAEMQHDTSVYKLEVSGKKIKVVGSLVYFRYSKQRYLKFYRAFNRFKMKCFFHEALTFYGYAAKVCIIDNTNLARLRGVGKNAIIVEEMEQFSRRYGFRFVCHEIGHSNRKAGNERSFYTVETNFFPGRRFESMEDINRQAVTWATERMANRKVSKSGLIPAVAFEYEKPFLVKVLNHVPRPYLVLHRKTDQYGYASVDGNYYWVPGRSREDVKILQYSNSIEIYRRRERLMEYSLPPEGIKNKPFKPQGAPNPAQNPNNRKRPTQQEEKKLRAISGEVDTYLDVALKPGGKQKHRFVRELFGLSQKIPDTLFIKTIKRAMKYGITRIKTIERIALLQLSDGLYEMPVADPEEKFRMRESYLEGRLTDEPDFSIYHLDWPDRSGENRTGNQFFGSGNQPGVYGTIHRVWGTDQRAIQVSRRSFRREGSQKIRIVSMPAD